MAISLSPSLAKSLFANKENDQGHHCFKMKHSAGCTCFADHLKLFIELRGSDFGGDENIQNLAWFLLWMLQLEPADRMPIKELLRYPFLNGGNQLKLIGGMCAVGRYQAPTDGA